MPRSADDERAYLNTMLVENKRIYQLALRLACCTGLRFCKAMAVLTNACYVCDRYSISAMPFVQLIKTDPMEAKHMLY